MSTANRGGRTTVARPLLATLLAAGLILTAGLTRGDAPTAAARDDSRKDVEDRLDALAAQLKDLAAQLRQQKDQDGKAAAKVKAEMEVLLRKAEQDAAQARDTEVQQRRKLEQQAQESTKKAEKDASLIKDLEAQLKQAKDQETAHARDLDAQLKQIKDLEAQVKQLKDPAATATAGHKAEQDAAQKYLHHVAELFLDSWTAEDYKTLRRSLAPDMLSSLQTSQPGDDIERWVQAVSGGAKYKSFAITTEVLGANMDEAIFRGTMTGKDVKGTFTVQILKDKQTGRSLISIFRIKPE
jgi:hypothetical protein